MAKTVSEEYTPLHLAACNLRHAYHKADRNATSEQDTTFINDAGVQCTFIEDTDQGDPAEVSERQSCKKIFKDLATAYRQKDDDHVCADIHNILVSHPLKCHDVVTVARLNNWGA